MHTTFCFLKGYSMAKKIKTKEPKIKKNKNQRINIFQSIRFRLIMAFLVPVACIIALGVATYESASNSLVQSYEDSTEQTVATMKQYISLILNSEKNQFKTYLNDADIKLYFALGQSAVDAGMTKKTIKDKLTSQMALDDSLCNVYFISNEDYSIYVAKDRLTPNLLEAYSATTQGQKVAASEYDWFVFGQDPESDEILGVDSSLYSLRLARQINKNASIVVNIKADAVRTSLVGLDPGENGYVALISSDGAEFYADPNKLPSSPICETEFYKDTVAKGEESGSSFVKYNGEEYLYIYSQLDIGDAYVVALIPQTKILSVADGIKNLTIILTLVAVVIALILGTIISSQMSGTINYIIRQLEKVSKGQLTVKLTAKKNDEFGMLCRSVNDTVENVKNMIVKVSDVGVELNKSADYVKNASDTFVETSNGIQSAITEIGDGMNKLDSGSEHCLSEMDTLSGNISNVSHNAEQISKLAKETGMAVRTGESSVGGLTKSAEATSEITQGVISSIQELDEKSRSIGDIVGVINGIAEQTNLLSLNASIEAARAGEAGRGFAVVAEEIRHLADQSQVSAGEIANIIVEITGKTQEVVVTAKKASEVVSGQSDAIDKTKASFAEIDEKVNALLTALNEITNNVTAMNSSRAQTLNAIEDISTVSNETSMRSSVVNESVSKQYQAGSDLENAADELRARADKLVEILGTFEV